MWFFSTLRFNFRPSGVSFAGAPPRFTSSVRGFFFFLWLDQISRYALVSQNPDLVFPSHGSVWLFQPFSVCSSYVFPSRPGGCISGSISSGSACFLF
jgi:hypothetical protein